jgi:photosystem II stability/assembly factor-like uncharacterized protein
VETDIPGLIHWVGFADASAGWAVGQGGVTRTIDGGSSWSMRTPAGMDSAQFTAGSCLSADICWVLSNSGIGLKTVDAGLNWTVEVAGPPMSLLSIDMHPSGFGLIGTYDGAVHVTRDAGLSWSTVFLVDSLAVKSVQVIDASIALAATDRAVYATCDGGVQWSLFALPLETNVLAMSVRSDGACWIAADSGICLLGRWQRE